MNGYCLTENWFNFVSENSDKVECKHTALYLYIVEMFNKRGWVDVIGLPTDFTMGVLNIKSYKNYISILHDLIDFGYIKMIEKSKNQYTSNKIALVKNTKANPKHIPKQVESNDQSKLSIIKLLNLETIKLLNNNYEIVNENLESWIKDHNKKPISNENEINEIYELYPTKCPNKKSSTGKSLKDKDKIKTILKTKSFDEVKTIIQTYLEECEKSKTWLKNFSTFLNNLPEPIKSDEQTEKMPNNDSIVVYTDADAFDPKREEKIRKEVFDEYVQRGKPVNFIRYARI